LRPSAPGVLAQSFERTLFRLTSTARGVALDTFGRARRRVLAEHFPGILPADRPSMQRTMQALPVYNTEIDAAALALAAIPAPRTPYPDFFAMSEDAQSRIVERLGEEWTELCALLSQHGCSALTPGNYGKHTPLAYHPLTALRDMLRNTRDVPPATICQTFLREALDFPDRIEKIRTSLAKTAALRTFQANEAAKRRQLAADDTASSEGRPNQTPTRPERYSLSDYDHVLATVGTERFHIPVNEPLSRIAARVVTELARLGNFPSRGAPRIVEAEVITGAIWERMPDDERALFPTKQKQRAVPIHGAVLMTLKQLTNQMLITLESSGEKFKIISRPTVSFETTPPPEDAFDAVGFIFPPGTPLEKIREFVDGDIPAEALTTARHILDALLLGNVPIEATEPVNMLSFIMLDAYGKRAIRQQLEAASSELTLDNALALLHERLAGLMGSAYEGARDARTIGSRSVFTGDGSRIRQVSRTLPITTITPASPRTTTKFHIARRKPPKT